MNPLSLKFLLICICIVSSQMAFGVVSFTVSGWSAKSNIPYQSQQRTYGSGKVSLHITQYVQVGISHRQDFTTQKGYRETEDGVVTEHRSEAHETTNSLDLTFVLYNGELFVPYIFGGIAFKKYNYEETNESPVSVNYSVPQGGAGFGLRINRNFMLKFFHTLSPGFRQNPDQEKAQQVLDSYSQVGISYHI